MAIASWHCEPTELLLGVCEWSLRSRLKKGDSDAERNAEPRLAASDADTTRSTVLWSYAEWAD